MNYHKITSPDIENGLGFRVTLWVSGCDINCPFCHNPETHNPKSGKEFTEESLQYLFSELEKPYIKGLSLSGGNPLSFYPEDIIKLVKLIKEKFPNKDIWLYHGGLFEDLLIDDDRKEVLDYIDVLVDGPFIKSEEDKSIAFRGSRNQRVINVPESLKENKVILI